MRDFSNRNFVEGTAAIDRFASVDGTYRQSANLNNVIQFPGCRNKEVASSVTARSNNDMKARAAARLAAREYADWYRPDMSQEAMDAIANEVRYGVRSRESECGLRAYAEYFSEVLNTVATTVRDGSFLGTPGPITSKVESAIAGTLVSAICLVTALF